MRLPYDIDQANKLNKYIFETIHYASLSESTRISKLKGGIRKNDQEKINHLFGLFENYKEYKRLLALYTEKCLTQTEEEVNDIRISLDTLTRECCPFLPKLRKECDEIAFFPSMLYGTHSPIYHGEFQWKMAGWKKEELSGMWDWDTLEDHIKKFGIRNSLTTALMPTASTSQIMGVSETIEPYTSNLYKRTTSAGEFIILNPYLVNDLIDLGIWNKELKDYLIQYDGSLKNVNGIPEQIKRMYKTAWEISQKNIINYTADRGAFIDHAQSLNLFIPDPTDEQIDAMLRYAWKKGIKTTYYLRTKPANNPQKITISGVKNVVEKETKIDLGDEKQKECLLCSS